MHLHVCIHFCVLFAYVHAHIAYKHAHMHMHILPYTAQKLPTPLTYMTSNPSVIFIANVFIIVCSSSALTAALLNANCTSRLLMMYTMEKKEEDS